MVSPIAWVAGGAALLGAAALLLKKNPQKSAPIYLSSSSTLAAGDTVRVRRNHSDVIKGVPDWPHGDRPPRWVFEKDIDGVWRIVAYSDGPFALANVTYWVEVGPDSGYCSSMRGAVEPGQTPAAPHATVEGIFMEEVPGGFETWSEIAHLPPRPATSSEDQKTVEESSPPCFWLFSEKTSPREHCVGTSIHAVFPSSGETFYGHNPTSIPVPDWVECESTGEGKHSMSDRRRRRRRQARPRLRMQ